MLLLHLREGVLYISHWVLMKITINSFFWSQFLICLNYREYVKNIRKANCTNCDIPREVWSRAGVEIPVFLPSERWVEKGQKGESGGRAQDFELRSFSYQWHTANSCDQLMSTLQQIVFSWQITRSLRIGITWWKSRHHLASWNNPRIWSYLKQFESSCISNPKRRCVGMESTSFKHSS